MYPDTHSPASARKRGLPDFDELHGYWFDRQEPRPVLPIIARAVLVVLFAVAACLLLGAAALDGLARLDATPEACEGLTRSACVALMSEGGAR